MFVASLLTSNPKMEILAIHFLLYQLLFASRGTAFPKLTLSRNTPFGGLLVKKFPLNGSDCTNIPEVWSNVYERWALRAEGGCAAVFQSENCDGDPKLLMAKRLELTEYLEKISVYSARGCSNDEELSAFTAPILLFSLKELTQMSRTLSLAVMNTIQKRPDNRESREIRGSRQFFNWSDDRIALRAGKPISSLVTFYREAGLKGTSYGGQTGNRCAQLPLREQGKISSIHNPTECVRVYDAINCRGRSIQIQAGDEYAKDLAELNFDKRIKSYGPCEEFQKLGLLMHNFYRGLHGSPALKMRESLNQAAQLMAEYLATQPALPRPIGFISAELFYATNNGPMDKRLLVRDAVQSWYKEGENYDWNNPVASRFTQLVWRNMNDFGIGTGRVGNRAVVVANYFPRGNFAGQFQENVLPLVTYSGPQNRKG